MPKDNECPSVFSVGTYDEYLKAKEREMQRCDVYSISTTRSFTARGPVRSYLAPHPDSVCVEHFYGLID